MSASSRPTPTTGTPDDQIPEGPKNVYYLGILRYEKNTSGQDKAPTELVGVRDMSSFSRFTRATYQEGLNALVKEVAQRIPPLTRQVITQGTYEFHGYGTQKGYVVLMVTENPFKPKRAQALLTQVSRDFSATIPASQIQTAKEGEIKWPELDKFQKQASSGELSNIEKVQKELDETKIVMHKTVESMLQRGEKLDDLVAKSDQLSSMSKGFYKTAKQQNSCCLVM